VAVSLNSGENDHAPLDYSPAARLARRIVAQVIARGLPKGVLLNVNVPYLPEDQIKGVKITRQGLRVYRDLLVSRADPRGRPYYWIGGEAPTGVPEEGTDFGALAEGYVSVTPLHLDLTAHQAVESLRAWEWS
jgi:5'-nucleotidase